jgi:mannose-6-phosphate isomerase-like protein (cupin superfamily)
MHKINLSQKFALIDEYWKPAVIGEMNEQLVKLAKIKGDFIMHKHDREDELFMVIKGTLHIDFEDRTETIEEGEIIIIPKGTNHKPRCENECLIMLFEPKSTRNTGNVENDFTHSNLKKI